MSFLQDFKQANSDFSKIKPFIESKIKGELIDIEANNDRFSKLFDQYSGIDYLQVTEQGLRGVAVRLQWGIDWGTFTIRYKRKSGAKTEFEKRENSIYGDMGFLYPYLTIQAYLDKKESNELLSFCIVRTKDLYDYIRQSIDTIYKRTCKEGNVFLVINFSDVEKFCLKNKLPIIIFKNSSSTPKIN